MTAADLDQSGQGYQIVRVYRGPSLGWAELRVKPQTLVTTASYQVIGGDSLLLVNRAGLVTVLLPSVALWVKEPSYNPNTGFENALWVKDFGGNAAAFNITVTPFGADKIDNLSISFTLVQNRQLLRLYPLNSLDGWISG